MKLEHLLHQSAGLGEGHALVWKAFKTFFQQIKEEGGNYRINDDAIATMLAILTGEQINKPM